MRPPRPIFDLANDRAANAKFLGKVGRSFPSVRPALYVGGLGVGKFSLGASLTPCGKSVQDSVAAVLCISGIFKIAQFVVGFIPVLMVYAKLVRLRANKGCHNKVVDVKHGSLILEPKISNRIAASVSRGSFYGPFSGMFNAAKVTDLIAFYLRGGFPMFHAEPLSCKQIMSTAKNN